MQGVVAEEDIVTSSTCFEIECCSVQNQHVCTSSEAAFLATKKMVAHILVFCAANPIARDWKPPPSSTLPVLQLTLVMQALLDHFSSHRCCGHCSLVEQASSFLSCSSFHADWNSSGAQHSHVIALFSSLKAKNFFL